MVMLRGNEKHEDIQGSTVVHNESDLIRKYDRTHYM